MTIAFKSGRLTARELTQQLPNAADSLPWPQPSESTHIGDTFRMPPRGWREEDIQGRAAAYMRAQKAQRRGWLVADWVGGVLLVAMVAALVWRAL